MESGRLVGKGAPFAYWPPEEIEINHGAFETILSGAKPRGTLELRFQRSSGEPFDALILYSALNDEEGKPKGWVMSVGDFTPQKRAEKEMEKKIARLASFPELNPNPVMEIDWAGQVLYLNPATRRLFPDLQNSGPRHPFLAGLESVASIFREARTTSHARDIRVGPSWYRQTFYSPPESNRLRVYAYDNTEQMEALRRVEDSERKYRALYEGSRDGYAFTDLNGTILEFNTAFKEMLGYPEEELRKLAYLDLTPPKWHAREAEIIRNQVLTRGYSKVYEKEYRRKDGTVLPVSLRTYLSRDAHGNPRGMWAFVRDITSRIKMKEELGKSRDRFALLSETASRLLESERPREIVEGLCRKVMDHLDCHSCFNYLVDEEKQRLRLNAYVGIPAEEARKVEWLNFGEAVCGCAARDGERVVAENISETPDLRTDLVRSYGIQAYACHPLLSQGKVIGTLSFGTRSRPAFSEDDLSLMKTVADQVSLAMERIRLYEKASLRAEELDRMVRERTHDLTERLKEMNCLCAMAGLLNREEASLEEDLRQAVKNIPPGWQFPEITCARVLVEGREFKTENFRETPWMQTSGILSHGKQAGILEVGYLEERPPRDEGPFLNEERTLLDALADQIGENVERQQAEAALRRSVLYNRSLIEASLDPLVTISPEGKITDVNRATEFATGVPRKDLIGSDFSDYFTDPGEARKGYEEAFRRGSVRDYPLAIRHASGRVTDILYNATVYRNESGEVGGVFAAARDITQRKQAEEALRQNEQLLRNVLELLPVGVWIADKEGVITYGNPAGHRIWAGYRYVGVEQFGEYKGWWLHTGKKIESEEWAVARAIRKGETSLNEEIEIECFDGSRRIILNSAIPMRNDRNEITGAFVINDDITERRLTEQRIRQMQKMEALGTLAGGIAHDFNNILMPIIINTEMALLDLNEKVLPSPHYLQLAHEAANRGQELVKQIITYSRQKEQPRNPEEILPIVKEALKFLRATIPANIEIRPSVGVESAVILADPIQIHQVLMNLCSNAAFAMREEGGILEVDLAKVEVDPEMAARHDGLKPGPYLRMTVRDTGHGMDREVRERAFDPFFTTKKPGEGTGMGLAVVQGIVKNHEGTITLESEVGKGTTVQVFLPWVQAAQKSEFIAPGEISRGSEKILLIDDEEMQVRSLQHALERLGYRITGKTDPREALEAFRKQPDAFDLVITDQTMPELTGAQVARELLRLRPDLPVILCTGFSETIDEEGARALGVRDFAMKPLNVRDLAGRIRKALKK